MAENLNYSGEDGKLGECYDNDSRNCDTYGRLYNWVEVVGCNSNLCANPIGNPHRGICPDGWHVPSDDEWMTLVNYAGGQETAGSKLKSQAGWPEYSGITSTNQYGFSALPGGYSNSGSFYTPSGSGSWWSATEHTEYEACHAWSRGIYYRYESVGRYGCDKNDRFSPRCIED